MNLHHAKFREAIQALPLLALGLAACAAPTPVPGALETSVAATVERGSLEIARGFDANRATLTALAPTATATSLPTPSASPTHTATRTATATLPPTPEASPTIPSGGTAVPTAQAHPPPPTAWIAARPGTYPQPGRCAPIQVKDDQGRTGGFVNMCVPEVVVLESGEMRFNVTWRIETVPPFTDLTKGSDVGNPNMYLLDNSGNRYDHIGLDGAARDGGGGGNGVLLSGSYLFPPALPGAFLFQFVDGDQGVTILNIDLRRPAS